MFEKLNKDILQACLDFIKIFLQSYAKGHLH